MQSMSLLTSRLANSIGVGGFFNAHTSGTAAKATGASFTTGGATLNQSPIQATRAHVTGNLPTARGLAPKLGTFAALGAAALAAPAAALAATTQAMAPELALADSSGGGLDLTGILCVLVMIMLFAPAAVGSGYRR